MVTQVHSPHSLLNNTGGIVPLDHAPKDAKNVALKDDQQSFSKHLSSDNSDKKPAPQVVVLDSKEKPSAPLPLASPTPEGMVQSSAKILNAPRSDLKSLNLQGLVVVTAEAEKLGLSFYEQAEAVDIVVGRSETGDQASPLLINSERLEQLSHILMQIEENEQHSSATSDQALALRNSVDLLNLVDVVAEVSTKIRKFLSENPDQAEHGFIQLPRHLQGDLARLVSLQQMLSEDNAAQIFGDIPDLVLLNQQQSSALWNSLKQGGKATQSSDGLHENVFMRVDLPLVDPKPLDPDGYEASRLFVPMSKKRLPNPLATLPKEFVPLTDVPKADTDAYDNWLHDISRTVRDNQLVTSSATDGRQVSVFDDAEVIRLMKLLPHQAVRDVVQTLDEAKRDFVSV